MSVRCAFARVLLKSVQYMLFMCVVTILGHVTFLSVGTNLCRQ